MDIDTPNLEDVLFEAGCDDALVHFKGTKVELDFDRPGKSFNQVTSDAIKDLELKGISAITKNNCKDYQCTYYHIFSMSPVRYKSDEFADCPICGRLAQKYTF